MLFNSWQFAVFLPVVFALFWALPKHLRPLVLLCSGYVYFAFGGLRYTVLLAFITLVSYVSAALIEKNREKAGTVLLISLVLNFGILFIYKYFNFFSVSLSSLFGRQGLTLDLLLPAGISFFTFSTASYMIDVYRGKLRAERSLVNYAAYVAYFPKLLAGPIERAEPFLAQLKEAKDFDEKQAMYGVRLIVWGLFKKMVIADTLAKYVNLVYADVHGFAGGTLFAAAFFYTVQIYCDFSGYSDIAMGVSDLFGIRLADNFRNPYMAQSIQGFWRRWHISLSSWFRDYIYIPLGGSRKGELRTALNTMIVFLVSGLWHGANWTFILWGLIHGLAQVIERKLGIGRKESDRFLGRWGRRLLVFAFALLTWIFFRADSISDALYVVTHLFSGIASPIRYLRTAYAQLGIDSYTVLCLPYMFLVLFIFEVKAVKKDPVAAVGEMGRVKQFIFCLLFVLMFIMVLPVRSSNEFLYFKF